MGYYTFLVKVWLRKKKQETKNYKKQSNTLCETTEHSLNEIGSVLEYMARTIKHIGMRLEMLEDHFYNDEPPDVEDDKKTIN